MKQIMTLLVALMREKSSNESAHVRLWRDTDSEDAEIIAKYEGIAETWKHAADLVENQIISVKEDS